VDPTTNRITNQGTSYDANGNLTAMPGLTMTYDPDNRMISNSSGDAYLYDAGGQRAKKTNGGTTALYFYGVEGNLLNNWPNGYNVYFGSKLIYNSGAAVVTDRLDSVVNKDWTTTSYFPYGDEPTTTTQNRPKFATYFRDGSTALDYAQQRYYASTLGRFTTPDPMMGGNPADPGSWNKYAYVQGDPVNFNDPGGMRRNVISFESDFYVPRTIFQVVSNGENLFEIPALVYLQHVGRAGTAEPYLTMAETLEQQLGVSEDCAHGLVRSGKRGPALERARAYKDTLKAAAAANGVDWTVLAAIGIYESGFESRKEEDGAGLGVGIFQINNGGAAASTMPAAANLAAGMLAENLKQISKALPNLTPAVLTQALADSWNAGPSRVINNMKAGRSPDYQTSPIIVNGKKTGKYRGGGEGEYGSVIQQLMDCF
jgi:RHS repeat-associated protein